MSISQPSPEVTSEDTFDVDVDSNEENVDFDFDFTKRLVDALRTPLQHEDDASGVKVRRCPFSGIPTTRTDDDSTSHFGSETASTHNNSPPLIPSENWVTGQAAHTCPYMRYQLGLPPLRRTPPPEELTLDGPTTTSSTIAATASSPPTTLAQVCPYTGKVAASQENASMVPPSAGCPFASQLASIPTTQTADATVSSSTSATPPPPPPPNDLWKDVMDREHKGVFSDSLDSQHPAVGRNTADSKSLFRRYRESKHTASEITALFNKVTLKTLQRDKKELQHVAVFGTSSVKKEEEPKVDEDGTTVEAPSPATTLPGPVASILSRSLAKPMAQAFMKASTNAFCERYFDLYLRMLSESCGSPKLVTVPSFLLAAPPKQSHREEGEEPAGNVVVEGQEEVQSTQHDAFQTLERELGTKLLSTITAAPKRTFLHDILRPLFVDRIRQLIRNWTKAVSSVLETRRAQRAGCPMSGKLLEAKIWVVEEAADALTFTIRSFSKQLRLNIMTPEAAHEVIMELLRCAHHYLLLVAYYETKVNVSDPGKELDTDAPAPATPCNATRASVYPAGHRFVALMLYSALSESLRFREYISSGNEKVTTLRNTIVGELISVQKYMENAIPGIKNAVSNFPGESAERVSMCEKVKEFKDALLPWCQPTSLMALVDSSIEAIALCAVFTAAINQHANKIQEDNRKKEQLAAAVASGVGEALPPKKKTDVATTNPVENGGMNNPPQSTNSTLKKSVGAAPHPHPPSSTNNKKPTSTQPPPHQLHPQQYHHQSLYSPPYDSLHQLPFQQVGNGPTLVTCPVTGATYNVTPVHPPIRPLVANMPFPYQQVGNWPQAQQYPPQYPPFNIVSAPFGMMYAAPPGGGPPQY